MAKSNDKASFDAAVQAEVAKQVAVYQAQFAQALEAAIKGSLQGVDSGREDVEKERARLEKEIEAAREAVKKTEQQGEMLAEAYFAKSRAALVEFTRKELLRELARASLERGRSVADVCDWLRVERDFVEEIITIMDRRVAFRREVAESARIRLPGRPRLRHKDDGRSGTINFENDQTTFDLGWEFGGGRAMVVIDIPTVENWNAHTKLPIDQRGDVLRFIAEQVVADQASGHQFEIGDDSITILR